jgi:hypothetical protein
MPSAQQNDFFEVELTNRGGKPLPAIEYDGQRWFVGEPGQEFMVQVNYTLQSGSSYEVCGEQLSNNQQQCDRPAQLCLLTSDVTPVSAGCTQDGWTGE